MSWYFFVFLYAVFKVHCPINPKRRWKFAFLTRVSIDWFTCLHTTGQLCHKVSCQHFWLIFISHMKSEASFKSHITGKVTPAFLPDVYHISNSTSLLIGWSRSPLSPCPYLYKTISQRPPPVSSPVPSFLFEVGGHLPSHTVSSAVLSAVLGLTVVFGMGTGVSHKRITTGKFLCFLLWRNAQSPLRYHSESIDGLRHMLYTQNTSFCEQAHTAVFFVFRAFLESLTT